jgi:predicted nucleic acid-binding protein
MIAVDTSTLAAYLAGMSGRDVETVDQALADQQVVLPPVVLCEMLSDPRLPAAARNVLRAIPLLTTSSAYWERAGLLRSRLLSRGLKARLADTLIAQSCIDHDVPLITRDRDFRHFIRLGLSVLF